MKDPTSLRTALGTSSVFGEDQRTRLVQDVDFLTKQAGPGTEYLKKVAPGVLSMLTLTGIAGMFGYAAAKRKYEQNQAGLMQSYKFMIDQPQFAKKPLEFHQRFHELAVVSPTVAANPSIASKVLEPRLDNGFNLDDVHRLSAIEYHKTMAPGPEAPSAAGVNTALSRLQQTMEVLNPDVVSEGLNIAQGKLTRAILGKPFVPTPHKPPDLERSFNEALRKHVPGAFGKEGAAFMEPELNVSEECLGRMLAETHQMCKQASVMGRIGGAAKGVLDFLKPSHDTMKDYFHAMAIPLAIGGGLALVNKLMNQKENNAMRVQADTVFRNMVRTNDQVKENPDLAHEAFDALRSFAPALAVKPLIAKTFVEHVIATDGRGLGPEAAAQLANTQSTISGMKDHSKGFMTGLKDSMSIFAQKIPHGGASEDERKIYQHELDVKKKKYGIT